MRRSSLKNSLAVLVTLILVLATLSVVYADYTYTSFEPPDVAYNRQFAPQGINNAGTIVGFYTGNDLEYHSFSLSSGTYTILPIYNPDAVINYSTLARGINDAGTIVGQYIDGNSKWAGFSLSGGTYTTLNTGETSAYAISNSGTIVGPGYSLSGGTLTLLPYYPSNPYQPQAQGINDAGTIVGYLQGGGGNGFILSNGTYTLLGLQIIPLGINNAGTIVGNTNTYGSSGNAFVLINGTYTSLNYPGAQLTSATGINNLGQIVGTYVDASGVGHGFVATPNSGPPASPVPAATPVTLVATGIFLFGMLWRRKKLQRSGINSLG
jgi:probable HAF family extracellular repeat protein